MNDDLGEVLSHWPAATGAERIQAVSGSQDSYSGAKIWRVDVGDRSYALRRWPQSQSADRLSEIHSVQSHLATHAPDLVPSLEMTSSGSTAVVTGAEGRGLQATCWDLSRWMSGEAISREQLSPAQIGSTMRALARVHVGALQPASEGVRSSCPWLWKYRDQYAKRHRHPLRSLSAAMHARVRGVSQIVNWPLVEFWPSDRIIPERPEFLDAMALVNRAAKRYQPLIAPWGDVELPLHPRHGDAQLSNFLFTDDEVTALVDYGAADLDSHAADVGRLLGSIVGDDPERRAAALDLYESVRPLSELERAAVDVFDAGGVIVAAARWISRLQPAPPEIPGLTVAPRPFDTAGFQRLRALVERVRVLAGEARGDAVGKAGTFA